MAVTGVTISGGTLQWAGIPQARKKEGKFLSGQAVLPLAEDMRADSAAIGAAIRTECPFLKGAVSMGIPSDEALLRVMKLPTSDPGEIRSIIELQTDKISPFPEEKMAVSHETLSVDPGGCLTAVVAVRSEQVEAADAICSAAGLDLCRIDVNAMAWWRILSGRGLVPREGRHIMAVPDGGNLLLIIFQDGLPICFRALASAEGLTAEEYSAEIGQEVNSLLVALDVEHGAHPVQSMTCWLKSPGDRAAIGEIGGKLGIKTAIREAGELPPVSEGLASRAAEFLNRRSKAGRAESAAIDLVPDAWRTRASARRLKRNLLAATLVMIGVWLAAAGVFFGLFYRQKNTFKKNAAELASLQAEAGEVRTLIRKVSGLESQLNQEFSALECITEISRLVPSDIALTSFQYQKNKHAVVRGECFQTDPIYGFKEALDGSGLFTDISMGSIQPQQRKNATVHVFQMVAKLPGGEL